jgi:hypothetical protein
MIDTLHKGLSREARKEIFKRTLYTNPYFYKLKFDIISEAIKEPLYNESLGINRDFYLTELMANFSDINYTTASLFNVSIYTSFLKSIYGHTASMKLPSSFILQDARLNTPIGNEIFDDRQYEIPPVLVKNNDNILAEIRNLSDKVAPIDGYIVLKGFNVVKDQPFLSDRETQLLQASLDSPVRVEYFEIDVRHQGLQNIVKSNDRFPRYILGFGITNDSTDKTLSSVADVTIRDLSRKISLTDSEIPIQFIAPRIASVLDTHIYYLPIEYYWQPFANLEFNINNNQVAEGDEGFKLSILTATI